MLQNLKDITGSAAHIRVGGTTANHATWVADQREAIIQNFATPGADQPANVTIGPKYIESFKTFPKGTKYTVGVTFDSGAKGENATVTEVAAFYRGLGDDLFAIEVGNEFDGKFKSHSLPSPLSADLTVDLSAFPVDRDTATWSIQKFVPEWLDRTAAIVKRVIPKGKSTKIFQAGNFVAPGSVTPDLTWTTQTAIDLGIASTGVARTFCTHQYSGAACRPVKPTLADSIMNRTELNRWMKYHEGAAAYSVSNGLPYVIGETNSIAVSGLLHSCLITCL